MLREYILQLETNKDSFQENEEKISHLVHQMGRAAMQGALTRYDVHSERIVMSQKI